MAASAQGIIRRVPGIIPAKVAKVPAPWPGVPVPKMVSQVAKILTAGRTNTPVRSIPRPSTVRAPVRVAPRLQRPIAPGMIPRKVWVSPKAAVPMRPRFPGANSPTVFDRLTRGRILQRGTR